MTLETLQSEVEGLETEVAALQKETETIVGKMAGFEQRAQEILNRMAQCRGGMNSLAQWMESSMPSHLAFLLQAAQDLDELPKTLGDAMGDLESTLSGALGRVEGAMQLTQEALAERLPEALTECMEAVRSEVEEVQEFAEEDFAALLQEEFDERVEDVCEKCAEVRESVEEHIEGLIETAKECVGNFQEKLDEFGKDWTGSVEEVKEDYVDLVDNVTGLGEDITTLTEAIDTALATTGVGMNAVTGTMDDICAVMGGVV